MRTHPVVDTAPNIKCPLLAVKINVVSTLQDFTLEAAVDKLQFSPSLWAIRPGVTYLDGLAHQPECPRGILSFWSPGGEPLLIAFLKGRPNTERSGSDARGGFRAVNSCTRRHTAKTLMAPDVLCQKIEELAKKFLIVGELVWYLVGKEVGNVRIRARN
jgi:hypothetical protein